LSFPKLKHSDAGISTTPWARIANLRESAAAKGFFSLTADYSLDNDGQRRVDLLFKPQDRRRANQSDKERPDFLSE